MGGAGNPSGSPARDPGPTLLRGLIPPAPPASASDVVEAIGLWRREEEEPARARPRVLLNMVSSADGLASLDGRSGGLSSPADRELFHALRAAVDGVLVGAGTLRAERYGRLIRDPEVRERRQQRGLEPEPLACVVSASAALDPDIPLLAEPSARVVLLTSEDRVMPQCPAEVSYVRCGGAGGVDLAAGLASVGELFGVRLLLCEGGPHLAAELVGQGLLDELFLSLAPKLLGDGDGPQLRILAGQDFTPPVELRLLSAYESESRLFLRYGVLAPERVSRETIESSSLAR